VEDAISKLRFLYLKTKTAIASADGALAALHEACGNRLRFLSLQRRGGLTLWHDGLAATMKTAETPREIASRIESALDKFATWAIHDGRGACAEFAGSFGPVSTYFQKIAEVGDPALRTIQLFVRFNPVERERDKALDEITRTYQRFTVQSAMYFTDGRIFLIHTDDSDKHTRARTDFYPRRLRGWALSEANGFTFGEGSWTSVAK
jgi:hypothetical protein